VRPTLPESSQPVPTLKSMNLFQNLPYHFFNNHFSIIVPSTLKLSKWCLLSDFPTNMFICSMPATCHVHPILRTSSHTADTKDLFYLLLFLSSKINHFSACTGLKWLQRSLSHLSWSSCSLYSMLFVTCLHPFYFHMFVLLCVHSGLMFSAMLYTLVSLCLSPRWCSGQCFCHWTQASWVQTRPRGWIFKGDKNPQHTFLRMRSKAGGSMS
jgi:hypothetical protein